MNSLYTAWFISQHVEKLIKTFLLSLSSYPKSPARHSPSLSPAPRPFAQSHRCSGCEPHCFSLSPSPQPPCHGVQKLSKEQVVSQSCWESLTDHFLHLLLGVCCLHPHCLLVCLDLLWLKLQTPMNLMGILLSCYSFSISPGPQNF